MTKQSFAPETTVVLATKNKGKIRELHSMLGHCGVAVLGLEAFADLEDVEETGATFEENALLKACAVSKATGLVALADDSGLEVDALNKAPGVFSARYSAKEGKPATDESNTAKLLAALEGVEDARRTGRFRCCMAACRPDGGHIFAQGAWEGRIAHEKAGENGFGYDPVFFDPEKGCTAAQMSAEEKNARSHRGRAVKALLELWPAFWAAWLRDHE